MLGRVSSVILKFPNPDKLLSLVTESKKIGVFYKFS